MRKIVISIIVIAAIITGGYFGFRLMRDNRQANLLSDLQTVVVSRGSLTATVGATGVVRADQTATFAWQTTGNVAEVAVEVGDVVEAGQVLASLEQTSLSQNVILAQADLINAQQALDELMNSQVATTLALQSLYTSQQAVIEAERAMDRFEEQDYKDDLEDARNDVIDLEDELDQAREDFEPYQDWDPTNETRQRYEQDLIDAQNNYDEAVRVVTLLELQEQIAQANLDAANARLADAQREYERLQDGPDPDDITVLEARIAAAQATLDQIRISAPFAGAITQVNVQPGDRVAPGTVAFRLDDLSRLLVDVRISEVDINRIQLDQPVSMSFDAILGKEYHGIVSQVSSVGVTTQGVVEFLVTVELTDSDEDVRPGMTAAVNIIVEQLDDVLLVPNRAVRVEDGQRVVYILQDGELTSVKITLGASSDIESEVINGELRSGDVVVLNPPQYFEAGGPPHFGR